MGVVKEIITAETENFPKKGDKLDNALPVRFRIYQVSDCGGMHSHVPRSCSTDQSTQCTGMP
jgi:hypothetical protein